jgi:transcriptional regulator with XRE-family HTH domain
LIRVDTQSKEELAGLVRDERSRRNWSQSELARRSGVSRPTISSLERGEFKRVRPSTLQKLGAAFHLDPEEIGRRAKRDAQAWEDLKRWVQLLDPMVQKGEFTPGGALEMALQQIADLHKDGDAESQTSGTMTLKP